MPTVTAFPFVDATRLFAKRGMTGATGNWYCGLHEVNDMAFALHLLRPDDHFVDVGANVGSYTILAAGAVGARVTAIEPIASTFALLEQNILLNKLSDRVRAVQCGASNAEASLRFSIDLDCMNHVVAMGENLSHVEVPVTTLDKLLSNDAPTLLKIDVEGYESAVLGGATKVLSCETLLAVIIETNGSGSRYGVDDSTLISMLATYGFAPFSYDPFARQLNDSVDRSGNTIFIKQRITAQQRLREAKRYQLVNGSI
jgi:FkbM family methyltransferase